MILLFLGEIQSASKVWEALEANTLLLHQGVVPHTNLAMAAGVAHHWDPVQLCWVPDLDDDGTTSVPGIAIAGDGAGIAGAWAAAQGAHRRNCRSDGTQTVCATARTGGDPQLTGDAPTWSAVSRHALPASSPVPRAAQRCQGPRHHGLSL